MKLYIILDDISGKKIGGITELNNDEEAKRAYSMALQQKTGPLMLVAFKPIDFRLVCIGEIDEKGFLKAEEPETVCRMDQLSEVN